MKKIIYFAVLSALFFIGVELLLALQSHPECGTAGVDYMPCGYSARFLWYWGGGSWMMPSFCWFAVNVGHFFFAYSKRKK